MEKKNTSVEFPKGLAVEGKSTEIPKEKMNDAEFKESMAQLRRRSIPCGESFGMGEGHCCKKELCGQCEEVLELKQAVRELERNLEDSGMIIRKLLYRCDKSWKFYKQAWDWLKRKNLQGTILRVREKNQRIMQEGEKNAK